VALDAAQNNVFSIECVLVVPTCLLDQHVYVVLVAFVVVCVCVRLCVCVCVCLNACVRQYLGS
jgi:hypothetical protein